jgi:hypothetical protein
MCDLVFNSALTKAATWFRNQRISRVETEEIEVEGYTKMPDSLVQKLIDQARDEAALKAEQN